MAGPPTGVGPPLTLVLARATESALLDAFNLAVEAKQPGGRSPSPSGVSADVLSVAIASLRVPP